MDMGHLLIRDTKLPTEAPFVRLNGTCLKVINKGESVVQSVENDSVDGTLGPHDDSSIGSVQ